MQQLNRKQRRALSKARKKGPGMHGRIRFETSYRIIDAEGNDVTEERVRPDHAAG